MVVLKFLMYSITEWVDEILGKLGFITFHHVWVTQSRTRIFIFMLLCIVVFF
jgi:hypothetical protein